MPPAGAVATIIFIVATTAVTIAVAAATATVALVVFFAAVTITIAILVPTAVTAALTIPIRRSHCLLFARGH